MCIRDRFRKGRHANTTLDRRVDYVALAQATGTEGTRVDTIEDFERALADSLSADGPTLIECPIGIDEFVTPVLQIGASMEDLIVNMDDVRARMGR